MRIFTLFLLFFLFFSCDQDGRRTLNGEAINTEEHLRNNRIVAREGYKNIDFIMVADPYEWDSSMHLIIYLNDNVVYSGKFERSGKLQIIEPQPAQLSHFRMEVIKRQELFRFENSTFNWDSSYKHIYIALFPDNPTTDNIYFFPQRSPVVQ